MPFTERIVCQIESPHWTDIQVGSKRNWDINLVSIDLQAGRSSRATRDVPEPQPLDSLAIDLAHVLACRTYESVDRAVGTVAPGLADPAHRAQHEDYQGHRQRRRLQEYNNGPRKFVDELRE